MAFTKIVGAGIHTLSNVHTHNINSSGIITATSFVGPFDGTTGDFSGNVTIDGNLVVNGDTTTLNTTLREVEILRVDANNSTVGAAITQSGSGDILNLYDGSTEVFSVADGGNTTMTGALKISSTTDQMLELNSSDNNGTSLAFQRNNARQGYIGYGGGSSGLIIANEVDNGAVAIQGKDGGSAINMLSFDAANEGVATLHGGALISAGKRVGFATDSNTYFEQDGLDRLSFTIGGLKTVSMIEAGTSYPVLLVDKNGTNTYGTQGAGYNSNANANDLVVGNVSTGNHGITICTPSSGTGTINFSDGSGGGAAAYAGSVSFEHANELTVLRAKSGKVVLRNDATDSLVASGGKIGIGTVSPDHNLHVHNSSGDSIISIESTGNGNHSALEFIRTSAGGDSKGAGSIYVTGNTSASEAIMKFAVGHNVDHTYRPNMVLMGNGEVGIGTDNPEAILDVLTSMGRIKFNNSGSIGSKIDFANADGTVKSSIHNYGGSNEILALNTSSSIQFNVANSQKLTITSTGLIRMGNGAEANTEAHITAAIFQNVTGTATILKLGNTNTPSSANNRAIEFCDGTGGTEGSSKYTYARIKAERTGGSNAGRLIFSTKPNNSDGPQKAIEITSDGDVLIGNGGVTSQEGDGRLIVYANTRLHPAIKADCIDGGVNRANGFTMLADNYGADESLTNIGVSYSAGGLVLSRGVKVSNAADNVYLSSVDSFATKPTAFKLDSGGNFTFLNTDTSATTTTDSAVTLKERLRINSAGRIKINHNQTPGQLDDTWLSIYDANSDSSANDPAGISKNYAMIALHNYGTGSPGDVTGIAFGAASSFAYTKSSIAHERTGSYGTGDLVFLTNNDQDSTLVNSTDEKMRITRDGKIKLFPLGDLGSGASGVPLYLQVSTNVTAINTPTGGSDQTGMFRIEDRGGNNNRFHGIELRNRNSGDIRILNKDIGTSNGASLVIAVDDNGQFTGSGTIRQYLEVNGQGQTRVITLSGAYHVVGSARDGSTSANAAASAWEIKKTLGPAAKTGYYYLKNPYDGTTSQWWCDMDTDGGGWVLIAHHGDGQMADQGTTGSHWWHRDNKGGFDTVGSGYKRGGGYWRQSNGAWGENTCGELMWDVRIHNVFGTNPSYGDYGQTAVSNHKVAFRWGTDQPLPTGNSNYTNIPNAGNRRFNEWCREVENAPGFNPGNYHQNVRSNIISGGNYFTEHMGITWCFRQTSGAADAGDQGPYWFIGQHANGLHQHYEENISGDVYGDGAVQLVSNQDSSWNSNPGGTNQGMLRLSKISDTGTVNIWLR